MGWLRVIVGHGVLGLAVLAMTSITAVAETVSTITDDAITAAVDRSLFVDENIPHDRLDTTTVDGVVTLTGTVTNLFHKERAVRHAQSIKGVRAVVDRIQVSAVIQPDDILAKNVSDALLLDPVTESFEVQVTVSNGHVTLLGTVQSLAEKMLATDAAKTVKGVRSVRNALAVKAPAQRRDVEIEAEITQRLRNDVWLSGRIVDVTVSDGVVDLRGTVGSALEKSRAVTLSYVFGVKTVHSDGIRVEWWARNAMRRSAYADRSDKDLAQAVNDALRHDPRVRSLTPVAKVQDGAVTLTGIVGSLQAKRAAEHDARNTVGVRAVNNYLKVRPAGPWSDDAIANHIRIKLSNSPLVDRYEIRVSVLDGIVYLTGDVDSALEKVTAEDLALRVAGVVEIKNRLTVNQSWTWRADSDIKASIQDELWWSPFVDEHQVQIEVVEGVATLKGRVDSLGEKDSATENALEGGAKSVRNYLVVE